MNSQWGFQYSDIANEIKGRNQHKEGILIEFAESRESVAESVPSSYLIRGIARSSRYITIIGKK